MARHTPSKTTRRPRSNRGQHRRVVLRCALVLLVLGAVHGLWRVASDPALHAFIERQHARLLTASDDSGLVVRKVLLAGQKRTDLAQVQAILGDPRGKPIFSFDPQTLQEQLAALPWVASARVERQLPDTLILNLKERTPLALWQHEGQLVLIDQNGAEIKGPDWQKFMHLPLVVGGGAPEAADEILTLLATTPELRPQILAAIRVGSRRWDIRLKNGATVQLPADNAVGAWQRLVALNTEHHLLSQQGILQIDLRLAGRMGLRLTNPPTFIHPVAGEKT